MSHPAADLPALDADALAPLVRAALAHTGHDHLAPRPTNDSIIVDTWKAEPFGHSLDAVHGTSRSVFRYSGDARRGGHVVPWSMVLKIVPAGGGASDPAAPSNTDRETLAYRSEFLARITGIRAPRCYAVVDRPAGGSWLWLEDVVDDIGREWPRARYALAARHLGEFNAAGCAPARSEQDGRAYPWLSRSPLADAAREMAPAVARIRDARNDAHVAAAISPAAAEALLRMLDQLDAWLARLDALPQTICHWDAHRANLFSTTSPGGAVETVAIDWAGVGWGPVGVETSKLLSQTVNFFGMREDALPALDREVFEAYIEGLRSGGWRGDARAARFGHAAASAARLVVRTASALQLAFNARAREGFERASGLPFAALAEKFRATLPYYLSLAEEAERLAREL